MYKPTSVSPCLKIDTMQIVLTQKYIGFLIRISLDGADFHSESGIITACFLQHLVFLAANIRSAVCKCPCH